MTGGGYPWADVKEEKKRKKRKVSAFQEAIKLGEEAAEAAAERQGFFFTLENWKPKMS